jgi:hypothetical protein
MATYPLSEAFVDGDVLSASDVNSTNEGVNDLAFGQFNAQTGTSYTLVLTDVAKVISLTNAAAITLTVPTNASVAFPVGTQILLYQGGAGQVTISSSATIRSQGTKLKIYGQYGVAGLLKVGTDEWVAFGNLVAWFSLWKPAKIQRKSSLWNTLSSLAVVAVDLLQQELNKGLVAAVQVDTKHHRQTSPGAYLSRWLLVPVEQALTTQHKTVTTQCLTPPHQLVAAMATFQQVTMGTAVVPVAVPIRVVVQAEAEQLVKDLPVVQVAVSVVPAVAAAVRPKQETQTAQVKVATVWPHLSPAHLSLELAAVVAVTVAAVTAVPAAAVLGLREPTASAEQEQQTPEAAAVAHLTQVATPQQAATVALALWYWNTLTSIQPLSAEE